MNSNNLQNNFIKIFTVSLIFLGIVSCESEIEKYKSNEINYAVHCELSTSKFELSIVRLAPINSDEVFQDSTFFVKDAEVYIYEESILFDKAIYINGKYQRSNNNPFVRGRTYYIEAYLDDQLIIKSKGQIIPKIEGYIEVEIDTSNLIITNDPDHPIYYGSISGVTSINDFYSVYIYHTSYDENQLELYLNHYYYKKALFFNGLSNDTANFNIDFNTKLDYYSEEHKTEEIIINIKKITPENFYYSKSLSIQPTELIELLWLEPSTSYTNLEVGYGVFIAYDELEKVYKIQL